MAVSRKALMAITSEVVDLLESPREVAPFTDRFPNYDLEDAYRVVADVRQWRESQGQRVIGRKIGFTNSTAWSGFGISGPIWNYLYDATTFELPIGGSGFAVGRWPNIRMETEIALGLGKPPEMGMGYDDLLECVEWAALDFEICTSIYPDWRFKVADAAATGVHVALLLGERHQIGGARKDWANKLASFSATLAEVAGASAAGGGAQVLGSPLKALGYLVRELARFGGEPLRAGEFVTTGTLTPAMPAKPGQVWTSKVQGIDFADIGLRLC